MLLRIKEVRKEKRMTLDELAAKSGVSKRMISAYEANENDITLQKLRDIAIALDVSMYKLIAGDHSDIELESEKEFQEWKLRVNPVLDKNVDFEFQQKYIDVLEQLIKAKNEIQRLKDEMDSK